MKVSEKAADAQRKTCKSSRKPWKQNIYKCGGSRLLHSAVCISEILPPGPVPKVYSDPWPEQYVMTRAQWKKINVNVFKEQSGSRSSGTFLCPLAWVPVNYSLVSAVLCVWLETELMHHCWTDSEWKMTHIMPPLKSSFITCNRQTDGRISWRQKSSALFRVLTSFGFSSSFKTQCFVQMFNSESEIIHKSIHNRFPINTSINQLLVFPATPFASSWKSSYSCYKCFSLLLLPCSAMSRLRHVQATFVTVYYRYSKKWGALGNASIWL